MKPQTTPNSHAPPTRPESVAPGHTGSGPGVLDNCITDHRVELLAKLLSHGTPLDFNAKDDRSDISQEVWSLLNEIDDNPHILSASQMLSLANTDYFKDFFTNAIIRSYEEVKEMGVAEIVYLLKQVCRDEPPSSDTQRAFPTTMSGICVFFEPARALRSLAKRWNKQGGPSNEEKQLLSTLPWASAWVASTFPDKLSKQTKARLVTKEAKLMLMRIFYPYNAPTWRDEHLVRVGDESVWTFKPLQWIDDVSNMWLGGDRRVRLTGEEMLILEQLPWFLPMIEQKRLKRETRDTKSDRAPHKDNATEVGNYDDVIQVVNEDDEDDEDDEDRKPRGCFDSDGDSAGAAPESQTPEV